MFLVGVSAVTAVPDDLTVTFQLRNSTTGGPMVVLQNATTINIYTAPTGGLPYWNLTKNITTGSDGIAYFHVTGFQSYARNVPYYYTVKIQGQSEPVTRINLSTVVYAFFAANATFASSANYNDLTNLPTLGQNATNASWSWNASFARNASYASRVNCADIVQGDGTDTNFCEDAGASAYDPTSQNANINLLIEQNQTEGNNSIVNTWTNVWNVSIQGTLLTTIANENLKISQNASIVNSSLAQTILTTNVSQQQAIALVNSSLAQTAITTNTSMKTTLDLYFNNIGLLIEQNETEANTSAIGYCIAITNGNTTALNSSVRTDYDTKIGANSTRLNTSVKTDYDTKITNNISAVINITGNSTYASNASTVPCGGVTGATSNLCTITSSGAYVDTALTTNDTGFFLNFTYVYLNLSYQYNNLTAQWGNITANNLSVTSDYNAKISANVSAVNNSLRLDYISMISSNKTAINGSLAQTDITTNTSMKTTLDQYFTEIGLLIEQNETEGNNSIVNTWTNVWNVSIQGTLLTTIANENLKISQNATLVNGSLASTITTTNTSMKTTLDLYANNIGLLIEQNETEGNTSAIGYCLAVMGGNATKLNDTLIADYNNKITNNATRWGNQFENSISVIGGTQGTNYTASRNDSAINITVTNGNASMIGNQIMLNFTDTQGSGTPFNDGNINNSLNAHTTNDTAELYNITLIWANSSQDDNNLTQHWGNITANNLSVTSDYNSKITANISAENNSVIWTWQNIWNTSVLATINDRILASNTSIKSYADLVNSSLAQTVITANSSQQYAIGLVNSSLAQTVITTNTSMKTTVDNLLSILNGSMKWYVDNNVNATMDAYVDARDTLVNGSLAQTIITTNTSMKTTLDAYNSTLAQTILTTNVSQQQAIALVNSSLAQTITTTNQSVASVLSTWLQGVIGMFHARAGLNVTGNVNITGFIIANVSSSIFDNTSVDNLTVGGPRGPVIFDNGTYLCLVRCN
jgi:hypothetical protein